MINEHNLEKANFRLLIENDDIGKVDERRSLMPLSMGKPGERLHIMALANGRNARLKLISLGLHPGDKIEVISNDGRGGLIVGRDSTRLALGRGMAQKIMVSVEKE
jgi:Fe2+ transport system protein FeoA